MKPVLLDRGHLPWRFEEVSLAFEGLRRLRYPRDRLKIGLVEPARAGGTPQGHGTPRRQPSYSELAQLQAIQASLVARGAGGGNDTDSAGGSLATPPGCHGDLSA